MSDGAGEGKGERMCLCEGKACRKRLRRRKKKEGRNQARNRKAPEKGRVILEVAILLEF